MTENKSEPSFGARYHNNDVGRTNAVDRSNTNFVKVWSELAEENFSPLEFEFSAFQTFGMPPLGKRYATLGHIIKRYVRSSFINLGRPNAPPRMLSHVTDQSN